MRLELEGAARCALVQAFARNMKIMVERGVVLPMGYLHAIMSIPPNVHWCTLDDQAARVYRAFVVLERERLATCGPEHGLVCCHQALEHRNALDAIIAQLPFLN